MNDASQLTTGQVAVPGQPMPLPDPPFDFTVAPDFLEYLKLSANPTAHGFHDGRFFPYSTAEGRRIGPGLFVWDKRLFVEGCLEAEINRQLVAQVYHAERTLRPRLAQQFPNVVFESLAAQQREVLLDFALSEGVEHINSDLLTSIIAGDWAGIFKDHQYVRYSGSAPDHSRNIAFVRRYPK